MHRQTFALLLIAAAIVATSPLAPPTFAAAAAAADRRIPCMSLQSLLADASEIPVAHAAQPRRQRTWVPLQAAMRMPLFPGLRRRRSCALIGSHPRALADMAKHRARITSADAVVLLNRANGSLIAGILGRRPDIAFVNSRCGAACTAASGGSSLIISALDRRVRVAKQTTGYLYNRTALMDRAASFTLPSTGLSALIFLLHICDSITLAGFSRADEAVQPSWYHTRQGSGAVATGVHNFAREGELRAAMRRCMRTASGRPRIAILE